MKLHTVLSTPVKSTMEKAWPHLWRKIYETRDFIPVVGELQIHEKTENMILRTMTIGEETIKDRIMKD